MKSKILAAGLFFAAGMYAFSNAPEASSASDVMQKLSVAVYDEEGRLELPEGIEGWVFLGSTVGMTYFDEQPNPEDPGLSSTVYIEPQAYRSFTETGEFPDGTVFAKVVRDTIVSEGGYSLGEVLGTEIHVKDKNQFPTYGFNFFFYQAGEKYAPSMPEDNVCVSCHQENAAFDNVFTQFYPTIRDRLK